MHIAVCKRTLLSPEAPCAPELSSTTAQPTNKPPQSCCSGSVPPDISLGTPWQRGEMATCPLGHLPHINRMLIFINFVTQLRHFSPTSVQSLATAWKGGGLVAYPASSRCSVCPPGVYLQQVGAQRGDCGRDGGMLCSAVPTRVVKRNPTTLLGHVGVQVTATPHPPLNPPPPALHHSAARQTAQHF